MYSKALKKVRFQYLQTSMCWPQNAFADWFSHLQGICFQDHGANIYWYKQTVWDIKSLLGNNFGVRNEAEAELDGVGNRIEPMKPWSTWQGTLDCSSKFWHQSGMFGPLKPDSVSQNLQACLVGCNLRPGGSDRWYRSWQMEAVTWLHPYGWVVCPTVIVDR